MKKTIVCILLSLLLILTALPLSVPAAETRLAASGSQLNIQTPYNAEEMTMDVSWNAIPNATGYRIRFYQSDPDGKFQQRGSIPTLDPDETHYLFDRNWFNTYGLGGLDYKVSVTVYLPSDQSFTEEKIFRNGVSILSPVTSRLLSNGVFVWDKVPNATYYTFSLYNSKGKLLSHISGGFADCMYDFSDNMTPGQTYYVTIDASAQGYRSSYITQSDSVVYDGDLPFITGFRWSGKTLRWNAVANASGYYVMLEEQYLSNPDSQNYGKFFERGGGFHRTTQAKSDFSTLLSELPKGIYRVRIFATNASGAAASQISYSSTLNTEDLQGTKITAASATVDAPAAGQAPDLSALSGNSAAYEVSVWYWYLYESPYPHLSSSDQFTAGKRYAVRITFSAKDGYYFDKDAAFSINGRNADYVGAGTYEVVFTASASGDNVTFSGTVNSFLSSSDTVTVTLFKLFGDSYTKTFTGNSTAFSIPNVKKGSYFYTVKKKNHATYGGSFTVGGLALFYVTLHPVGDINGDGQVTTVDFGRANSHARGKSTLSGYEFNCADVNGDTDVTTVDAGRINSHARGKSKLW